jgi:hypothetical protein
MATWTFSFPKTRVTGDLEALERAITENNMALETWINARLTVSDDIVMGTITDMVLTSVVDGELLRFDGTNWINNTLAEAGVSAVGHTHTYLPLAGGTMAGDILMGTNDITGIGLMTAQNMQFTVVGGAFKDRLGFNRFVAYDSSYVSPGYMFLGDSAGAVTMSHTDATASWAFTNMPTVGGVQFMLKSGGTFTGAIDMSTKDITSVLGLYVGNIYFTGAAAAIKDGSSLNRIIVRNIAGDSGNLQFLKANGSTNALLWNQASDRWDFATPIALGGGATGGAPTPRMTMGSYYDNTGPTGSPSHIDLYGGSYGFGISSGTVDYISVTNHTFWHGATKTVTLTSTGFEPGVDNTQFLGNSTFSFAGLYAYNIYDEAGVVRLDLSASWTPALHIIPEIDNTSDLGSSALSFKDLYIHNIYDEVGVKIIDGNGIWNPKGNVIPSVDNAHDLGSGTLSWKNIYAHDIYDESGVSRIDLNGDWRPAGGIWAGDGNQDLGAHTGFSWLNVYATNLKNDSDDFHFVAGQGTITDTNSTVAVTHGQGGTPSSVVVTPSSDERLWVTAIGATTFTVNRAGTSGAHTFNWAAFA